MGVVAVNPPAGQDPLGVPVLARPVHLGAFPPKERWDDWVELSSRAWPAREERHYLLIPTTCFNCESACGLFDSRVSSTMSPAGAGVKRFAPGLRGGPGCGDPGQWVSCRSEPCPIGRT